MSILTYVGAGQMASALTYPVIENGHEVRLVGTPLDREIIDELRRSNFHINLKRTLPDSVKYYQVEEVEEALKGADIVLCGVSSFGVDWFAENILPIIPDDVPMIAVTKGMIDQEDGSMITYPHYWESRLPEGKKLSINGIGGPCTSYELAYALGVSLAVGIAEKNEGIGVQHYNSQAALFGQSVKEMKQLLNLVGGGEENIIYGAGDLYVTIFGGRTRKIGTLLGRGMSFDDAMEELAGVTLESIVIATRTAKAVRRLAENGKVDLADFPLLMHVDDIINKGAEVDIPWKAFETEKF